MSMNTLAKKVNELIELLNQMPNNKLHTGINFIRKLIHEASPCKAQPVDYVLIVPLEQVEPNDYNPNSVAGIEMGLLLKSIEHDGYTQPVVTIYDEEKNKYIIVDGFHRYFVMKSNKKLYNKCKGLIPITVINKSITDRMASTVRHNRARGRHSVNGMSSLVFSMLENGMSDTTICNELGMEAEELLRLKHITGFSKLFKNTEYKKSWQTKNQILIKKQYESK